MSYKDDEDFGGVNIKEDEIDLLISPEDLDDPLDNESLEDDLFTSDEDDGDEFAGLDGSIY